MERNTAIAAAAGLAVVGTGAALWALSSRPEPRDNTPPEQPSGSSVVTACQLPATGPVPASLFLKCLRSGDPNLYRRSWTVLLQTFSDLHQLGAYVSGVWMLREGKRSEAWTEQQLRDLEQWVQGLTFLTLDPAHAQILDLDDRLSAHILLTGEHARIEAKVQSIPFEQTKSYLLTARLLQKYNEQLLPLLRQLNQLPRPLWSQFRQVIDDYAGKQRFAVSEYPYPPVWFPNYRWFADMTPDLYRDTIEAYFPGEWGRSIQPHLWRPADANGWPGGWLRDPKGHPYYWRVVDPHTGEHKLGWGEPTRGADRWAWRLFAKAGETLVHEYATLHFLQTVYLSSLDLNTANTHAKDALRIAGGSLAAIGAIGAAVSSTGVGAIATAAIAVVKVIADAVGLALAAAAKVEREAKARLYAAQRANDALQRFGLRVSQFWGWQAKACYPIDGMRSYRDPLVFTQDANGQLVSSEEVDTPYSIQEDPWYYFRVIARTSGAPQMPLMVLRPDFDLVSTTTYGGGLPHPHLLRIEKEWRTDEEIAASPVAGLPRVAYSRHVLQPDQWSEVKAPTAWGDEGGAS